MRRARADRYFQRDAGWPTGTTADRQRASDHGKQGAVELQSVGSTASAVNPLARLQTCPVVFQGDFESVLVAHPDSERERAIGIRSATVAGGVASRLAQRGERHLGDE